MVNLTLNLTKKQKLLLKKIKRRQFKFPGTTIVPSTKLFFGKYFYKCTLEGNKIHYEIEPHCEITDWLDFLSENNEESRQNWNKNNRRIYLSDPSHVEYLLNNYPELIQKVEGPTAGKHLEKISSVEKNEVVRPDYFYSKYDVRFQIKKHSGRPSYGRETPAWFKRVKNWVADQAPDATVTVRSEAYYNSATIYMTSEDYEDLEGFMLIEFNDIGEITETKVIKV